MEFINQPTNQGHFDATNLDDLMMFRKAFTLSMDKVNKVRKELADEMAEGLKKAKDPQKFQCDLTFKTIPKFFNPELAKGWNANILFKVDNIGEYTIKIENGKATSEKGAKGEPTCIVTTDLVSLTAQINALRMEAMRENDELSDSDLEMVAGGKGGGCGAAGCGAAASGASSCGADGCGAAAGGATACGAAAMTYGACGAAACGAAVCHAAACGADACGLNACVGDICAVNVLPVVPGI